MSPTGLHAWNVTPAEAASLQTELRRRLIHTWDGRKVDTVGGIDVSVKAGLSRAAVVVLRFPELALVESAAAEAETPFPYIPGLLTFREGPVVLAAWEQLHTLPDLVMFDGQGIAHPRGMGIAAHLGLWLEKPTIGVAKSRLYGRFSEPGPRRGDQAQLTARGQVIGAVVRTRDAVKPLFVSPGHLIDVPHAVEFTLNCVSRYRLPVPIRLAHQAAGESKR